MDLKYQKPAQGLSLNKSFNNTRIFNVECDCNEPDHAIKMWIEVNRESHVDAVEVSFYVTTYSPSFWNNLLAKFKAISNIIFKGVHKQEHHMILAKQTALNFAETIKETIKELEKK